MKKTRNSAIALGCVLALGAGASDAALAKGLHKGKYQCYQFDPVSGYLYWGSLKIKDPKRYVVNGSQKGKYRLRGRKVKWVTGPLAGWTGRKETSKKIKILGSDGIEINCNR